MNQADEKKNRIEEAEKFFNLLYGKIPPENYVYLWTKKPETFSFSTSDAKSIQAMAQKAVELSEKGFDVYHCVNAVEIAPTTAQRGSESTVSFQNAIVTDIDISGTAHTSKNLAASFDAAKSFLPFTPSILIHSGHGAQAYFLFDSPIEITDQNREEFKRRNNRLLDLIRQKAKGKTIDGVGDLPRIMRTPGTFNYKLGKDNAPLCHVVEYSGARYSPTDIDEKLNALLVDKKPTPVKSARTKKENFFDNSDYKNFRVEEMLRNISGADYEIWYRVGMALKNEGYDLSLWERWSSTQPKYTPEKRGYSCAEKWETFKGGGVTLGTLYYYATLGGGYDEKETFKEWLKLHPEFSKKKFASAQIDLLKLELRDANMAVADFDKEKDDAVELLRSVEVFDSDSVFSEKIIKAAAFARAFDSKAFSDFKSSIALFNRNTTGKKTSVNDWLAAVKEKVSEIKTRQTALITKQKYIQAEINSLSFVEKHDALKDFSFPKGYSVSEKYGVEKVAGENFITVCRSPILISGITHNVEEKTFKKILSYMTEKGEIISIPPIDADIPANSRKIVDLAKIGFPVISTKANLVVDYLDAFNAENEKKIPLTYLVNQCGWYKFDAENIFVAPGRPCFIPRRKIPVKVDETKNDFARHLKPLGSLEKWKEAEALVEKSLVASFICDCAVSSPLLYVLGERNFTVYIKAPTRAGKTTALIAAAANLGSEKMIRSFDATKNGLIVAASECNDFTFFIDEKQVADKKIIEQAANIIYDVGNGVGRTKLNKDSTLKKQPLFRILGIISGETDLIPDNATGGAFTRLLTINAPAEILSADACKKIRDISKENFGHVLPKVVDKIVQLGFEKLRGYYDTVQATFNGLKEAEKVLPEYCRYISFVTLGGALKKSAVDNVEFLEALETVSERNKQIFALIPTKEEISDTQREIDFLRNWLNQNQNRFIGGNVDRERMQIIFGDLGDDDFIFITVLGTKTACKEGGFDYRKLVSDLVSVGFFVPDDKSEKGRKTPRATVSRKIGATTTRCYRIPRAFVS